MKELTPIRAIRAYCIECSGSSTKEVSLCQLLSCPLYLYRMGKRPTAGEKEARKQAIKAISKEVSLDTGSREHEISFI